MVRPRLVPLIALALVTACSGDDDGPFDKLTLDGTFSVGLEAKVHVARDVYGVAHIHGKNLRDVAFVQGYVMAHDRLPQMDILRRFGAGTVSEIFGSLDPSVIDTDLEMRMHRMKPLAQETLDQLRASGTEIDADIVNLLERFADGVNAYATDIVGGKWQLDPNLLASFDPERFVPWSPVDSLVLGRFQAFALSWTAPLEIELSELYQALRAQFPGGARAGVPADILTFKPVGLLPTIDGFPNVGADGGTRSDGSSPPSARTGGAGDAHASPAVESTRPHVPKAVFDAARTFFAKTIYTGPFGSLGPHAFMRPYAGSNNWAIGPELTREETAILATDQHLQLPNPSIFYPTHLIIDDGDDVREPDEGEIDAIGVTFPGIPGVILGSNGRLAWSGTVSEHDVNDVYLETIDACPTGECVRWKGDAIPIETFPEEIRVGALGTILETFTATYERVPHHGPLIPQIDRTTHRLVPRPAGTPAFSVRYTGYVPTFEIRALVKMTRASSVAEGFQALADFSYGSQNWTMIDQSLQIGWTTNAHVPDRSPATYQWNAKTRPDAAAPFFVLSGEGNFEWEDRMSTRYVPHAMSPIPSSPAKPQLHLATANADPVGATFDNDPLNQPLVNGRPLYAGVAYAAGVRQERITRGIEAAAAPVPGDDSAAAVTPEEMQALQHDSQSTVGAKMTPRILAALGYVATPVPAGAPADVALFVNGLPAADRDRLVSARTLLGAWRFATPIGNTPGDASSASTAIFNAWMHFFIEAALADELSAVGRNVWSLGGTLLFRVAHELLDPATILSKSAATGQPILCDRVAPGPDDSCTKIVLEALLAAMKHLESPAGFGTAEIMRWEWGNVHRLTIQPLFPNNALDLPRSGETSIDGFAKAGDNFNVNRADAGWADLDFSQFADGAAQRFIAVARRGEPIKVRWQIPGGVIFDSRSPHYRDLLDKYYLPETHFDAPFLLAEIVRNGEVRWEFR